MTEQDYSLYKIYKEFLSIKHKNFFSFITKKTKIIELYKERNNSFISANYHIEHFFIIILIIFFIIQGVISIINIKTLIVILIESISIVLLIASLLISFIKKVKKNTVIIAWAIFSILLIESSVIHFIINDYEEETNDINTIKTYQSTRIHKVTYSIIGFHFVISNIIKINSTIQIGHYIAMFVIDIIYGFVMMMLTKEFYYELISIGFIDFYIALNESKHELLHFKSFIEEINDKVKRYESEKMFNDVCISKCKCNINLNDDGNDNTNELLKKKNKDIFLYSANDVFENTFDFMIKTNCTNNLISLNDNENHTNIIKKTSNSSMCLNIDDSSSGLSITKSTGLLLNKKTNRKISLDFLYKKVSTKNNIDKSFDTTDRFIMQSLYDVIYEIVLSGETDDKYKEIGVFTCKITQSLYKVFVHIGKVDKRLKQIVNVEFDLIFVEMTKEVDDYRQKIENMYHNLIMSKISNEFREGIATIINVIHTIKANSSASPNIMKDSSTSIGQNGNILFPVHIDTLNRLSAISECVLIIVADLAEYVNIKSSTYLMNKNDVNKSYYSLMELKLFLEEASRFYISLFRKKVNVIFRTENDINYVKVLTNEMKLKQIITNIISNAIKQTPNNKNIIVSLKVIKEESHVIDHSDNSSQNKGTKKNSEADTVLFNDNIVKFANSSNSGDIKIAISIEDEGKGIPLHLMQRVNNGEVLDDSPRDIEAQKDYANAKGLNVGLKIIVKLSTEIEAMLNCTHVLSNKDKIIGTKFTLELIASNGKGNKRYSIESARNIYYDTGTFNEEIITSKKQCKKAYSIRYDGMTVNKINQTIIDKIQIKIAPPLNASPLIASRVYNNNEPSDNEDAQKSKFLCIRTPSKKPNSSKHIPLMRKFSTHNIISNRTLSSKKSKNSQPDNEIENKIAIVDDSANHRTNLENLIKRYFKKKKKTCSIHQYEDGAELLGELFKEIKSNDGHCITKFIFCDENMMFINGSQCFNILRQCEIKSTCDIKIPFVLCSADANSLRTPMKSIGLEFVYDKPLSIGDLDYIFSSKMVNKIQNNISFDTKKSE